MSLEPILKFTSDAGLFLNESNNPRIAVNALVPSRNVNVSHRQDLTRYRDSRGRSIIFLCGGLIVSGLSKAESGNVSYAALLSDGRAMPCKGSKQSKASAKPQRSLSGDVRN